jgi:hypothetical protein
MADDKKHFFKPMVGDFTETMVRKHLKLPLHALLSICD